MEWGLIKEAGSKSIDGNDYDLRHLQDSTFDFTIPATSGFAELNATMLIQFSSHCISIGSPRGEQFDFAALGRARLVADERGNERCFCPDRYDWSKNLPGIIRSLPTDRMCYFTGHENWLSIEILDPQGLRQIYEVFFNLTRQSSKFLRVYVESAYARTSDNEHRRPSDFRRGAKIAARCYWRRNFAINGLRSQDAGSEAGKAKGPVKGNGIRFRSGGRGKSFRDGVMH